MKTCPVCKRTFPTKEALATHRAAVHGGQLNRRAQGGGPSSGNSITFTRSEYIGPVTSKNVPLRPGSVGARQLDSVAAVFEQYRWDSLSFRLKPTVGANTDGSAFVGLSYEPDHTPTSKTDIASCSPSDSFPVSRERTIVAPVRLLMHSPWLATTSNSGEGNEKESISGYFNVASDKALDLWIHYTVTLSGPTSVPRKRDAGLSYADQKWTYTEDGSSRIIKRSVPVEGPIDIDLEVASSVDSVIQSVITNVSQIYSGLREIHRFVSGTVTLVHMYADAVIAAGLTALAVPAIIHQRQLPFRPTALFLRLCRSRGVEVSDSAPYRSVVRGAGQERAADE